MPEVRLCDKDAEIERIKQYCSARGCKYKYWSIYCKACEVSDIIDEFESAQEVEAKPVRRGRWIPYGRDTAYTKYYRCSLCGYEIAGYAERDNLIKYNYCANCGADMMEASEDATD